MAAVTPTKVTFTHPLWQLDSMVQLVQPALDGDIYVITEATPFHPVSHIWPDHPADRGTLTVNGKLVDVKDCLTGAFNTADSTLHVGKDIPVKRDEEGWHFVVVHLIDSGFDIKTGDTVSLSVDADYQQALSRGHSGAHLTALALNKVLHEGYWRKAASRIDPLGHYDFHSYAEQTSFVETDRCIDSYRLGKTLRKRGLNSADMVADLADIETKVNLLLEEWLTAGEDVNMARKGDTLTDSRYWQSKAGGQDIEIPCGGTHIQSFKELGSLKITLTANGDQEVVMTTLTSPA
ncbi:alanyl-tRNA editing protein [Parasalinivibrio latis]|uniref:alanyl-tRNA editing protein n=1 Tax=Parasalinivibrio latis TaxID=2952610 RepID=UPI0030E0E0FC